MNCRPQLSELPKGGKVILFGVEELKLFSINTVAVNPVTVQSGPVLSADRAQKFRCTRCTVPQHVLVQWLSAFIQFHFRDVTLLSKYFIG